SIQTTKPGTSRLITVTLSGNLPGNTQIQLPIFLTIGVTSVTGGSYNTTTHTVTADPGATSIAITLAS
uniref:hypothetical protein n=1 Tax=Actinoplanes subtropicus TaxID=543632 RepID=UPI0005551D07